MAAEKETLVGAGWIIYFQHWIIETNFMNKTKIIIALFILFSFVNCSQIKNNGYNEDLSKLIFSNNDLKNKFLAVFELDEKGKKIFKVVVSRRSQFVRISIFQIINKEDLNEFPSSYFIFRSNTFLCYDGSEIITSSKLDKDFIDKLRSHLQSNVLNNTRVFQFDIDSSKKIRFNIPAINPYDLTEKPPLPQMLFRTFKP